MSRKVILVHGINNDGSTTVHRLAPILEARGLTVKKFSYPHTSFWDTWSKEKSDTNARALLKIVEPGDNVIFHSNGARVTHRAMQMGAAFGVAIAIAPAFGARTPWPDAFTRMHVLFNPRDRALWTGALVPFHDYGLMGVYGAIEPKNWRISNHSNYVADAKSDENNHSQMFREPNRLADIGEQCSDWILA